MLILIPARGGSKGILNKNQKLLNGKPLLFYSIDLARKIVPDEQICVSTDSKKTIELCKNYGLKIPFIRPAKYATDTASTDEVIAHALAFFSARKLNFKTLILLQPTSPFRTEKQLREALKLYTGKEDMVVSVTAAKSNPYYNLMEETKNGFLKKSKLTKSPITRRQDVPPVYEINGAIYIINVMSFLKKGGLSNFNRIKKYLMPPKDSLDIDSPLDWEFAEFLLSKVAPLK